MLFIDLMWCHLTFYELLNLSMGLVTVAVLFWYTYETHKLRTLAKNQVDVANLQANISYKSIDLMTKQTEFTRESLALAEQQLMLSVGPTLQVYRVEARGGEYVNFIENSGNTIYQLELVEQGSLPLRLVAQNSIGHMGKFEIHIGVVEKDFPIDSTFKLAFYDKSGHFRWIEFTFKIVRLDGKLQIIFTGKQGLFKPAVAQLGKDP